MPKNEACNPCDQGKGLLLCIMDHRKPSEIPLINDILWIVAKYNLLTNALQGECFSDKFLLGDEGALLETYIISLENELSNDGIDFKPSKGITDNGWATFREKYKKMLE